MVAIVSLKREAIHHAVEQMYTEVAESPGAPFHFPVGREAARLIGYPESELAALPAAVLESFAGVGYPFAAGVIREGDTVLDIGSGSGTDAFIAARLVGTRGKVYALDRTAAMRDKLTASVARAGLAHVETLAGDAEAIPLPDASVDVVATNGVLNLVPDKARAIREIRRVLKPGGRLQVSDIALAKAVSGKAKRDPKLWAECIVGAVEEEAYFEMFRDAGMRNVEHVASLDYFAHASGEDTRLMAGYFGAHSVTFRARILQTFEQAAASRDDDAARRFLGKSFGQLGAIAGAVAASAACFGAPAIVAALTAIGATTFTEHATLYPLFVGFIALCLWQLHSSAHERGARAPFWLGLAGGVTAAVFLWLMVTGIVPLPGIALYGALGVLIAGSLWDMGARFLEVCIVKVRREMNCPQSRKSFGRRAVNVAAIAIAAATAFYGLQKSVAMFAPRAEASATACPSQNGCKGDGFRHVMAQDGMPLGGSPADPARRNA